MPDVHIVTSTSAQGTGREANADRMAQQFTRRPNTVYVRTPGAVDVFAAWDVASERGAWTGRWTEPDGVVNISGTCRRPVAARVTAPGAREIARAAKDQFRSRG